MATGPLGASFVLWGASIPIALVGASDARRFREDRQGLSLKAARDPVAMAMSSRGLPIEKANAGDRKLSGQRRRQFGRREAGLRGGVVLVDDPTQHVATADVAERRGSRGHCADRCTHSEAKAAVRSMLVVMPDVVAKDCFEVIVTENERPVEALFSYGPYPPLRDARGDLTGVLITSIPSETNTSSKPAVNFASRSRSKNRNDRACSLRSPARLRATWVTKEAVG